MMRLATALYMVLLWSNGSYAAVDSYRYMHVTVETPYTIFLFLLVGILAPFALMGILVWRFVGHKSEAAEHLSISPDQEDGKE
jgi:hypothetical protein